jgi:hypothetical protein
MFAFSISDWITGILHLRNSYARTMVLGLTQPLKETTTRNISWGVKDMELTTLTPSYADCREILEPEPPGTLWACNRPVKRMLYLYSKQKSATFEVQLCTVTSDSISEIPGSFEMWSWRRMEIIWTNHMRNKEALQGTQKERNILDQ